MTFFLQFYYFSHILMVNHISIYFWFQDLITQFPLVDGDKYLTNGDLTTEMSKQSTRRKTKSLCIFN